MESRAARDRYARERRHRAPAGMIEAATAARLAGDWRAACAAAMIDVDIDGGLVAARFGADEAARIDADLAGLAPDYLRLHLPYNGEGRLAQRGSVVLSTLTTPFRKARRWPRRPGTAVLVLTLPPSHDAPQRLRLRVADISDLMPGQWRDLPPWAWQADAMAERRWAYGASDTRLPWHPEPKDGAMPRADRADRVAELTALPDRVADFGALPGPADRAAEFEALLNPGTEMPERFRYVGPLATRPLIAAEDRRLHQRYDAIRPRRHPYPRLHWAVGWPIPRWSTVEAPMDALLLRHGTWTPDQLHPLAHEALFPGRTQHWQPARHDPVLPVRVRCGGVWHLLEVAGASLRTLDHPDGPGSGSGCAAALAGFRTGRKPAPKAVRRARRDLFDRAFFGDTDGILADLRAGADPQVRDAEGRTLLHRLAHVDHRRVLPLLLAAGFAMEDRDAAGRTPLHTAALTGAEDVVAALIAAGADPAARDAAGRTIAGIPRA
ncbi:MAG: ankyrin repeat domain-containing protein [Actinoplanes sp.]